VTRVPERSEERSALDTGAAGARRKSQPSARRLWKIDYRGFLRRTELAAPSEGVMVERPERSEDERPDAEAAVLVAARVGCFRARRDPSSQAINAELCIRVRSILHPG
jgi:hypothetical protein